MQLVVEENKKREKKVEQDCRLKQALNTFLFMFKGLQAP